MRTWLTNSWLWWIVAGASLGAAQLAAPLWPLTLVGTALLVLAVFRVDTLKQAALGGWLAGALKSLGGFAWIWHSFPILWLGIDSQAWQFLLLGAYWATTAACMGLGLAIPAAVAYRLRNRFHMSLLIVPIAWLVGEAAGSLFVSVWLLGSGGYVAPVIGNGYAGLPLAQVPFLLPITAFAGLYGLTYIAALVGMLTGWLAARLCRAAGYLIVVLITLILIHGLAPAPHRHPLDIKVMAIDTSFTSVSQETAAGRALKGREVFEAVRASLTTDERPDVILLPEDSRFTSLFRNSGEALAYLNELAPDSDAIVVDSARTDIGSGSVALRAFYYDLARNRVYETDKQFLTPQGEYVTYPFEFLLRAFGRDAMVAQMSRDQNYVPGPLNGYEGFAVSAPAILFCSESLSIWSVRQAERLHQSPLVLHPVSHGRFHEPYLLLYQLSAMLRVQAVWNGTTIVTAANRGESQAFHPDGTVTSGREVLIGPGWRLAAYEL